MAVAPARTRTAMARSLIVLALVLFPIASSRPDPHGILQEEASTCCNPTTTMPQSSGSTRLLRGHQHQVKRSSGRSMKQQAAAQNLPLDGASSTASSTSGAQVNTLDSRVLNATTTTLSAFIDAKALVSKAVLDASETLLTPPSPTQPLASLSTVFSPSPSPSALPPTLPSLQPLPSLSLPLSLSPPPLPSPAPAPAPVLPTPTYPPTRASSAATTGPAPPTGNSTATTPPQLRPAPTTTRNLANISLALSQQQSVANSLVPTNTSLTNQTSPLFPSLLPAPANDTLDGQGPSSDVQGPGLPKVSTVIMRPLPANVTAGVGPDDVTGTPAASILSGCPAIRGHPPISIVSQEALKSCPMVVINLVAGRSDATGVACSNVIITNNNQVVIPGWQLVFRQAGPAAPASTLMLGSATGAEIVSGTGGASPYRVVNSYTNPNITGAGGLTAFSLATQPRSSSEQGWSDDLIARAATAARNASLDWSSVSINGQSCSKIPSRSLLLDDCDAVTYGLLPSWNAAPDTKCTSVFCCGGDFITLPPQLPPLPPLPGQAGNASALVSQAGKDILSKLPPASQQVQTQVRDALTELTNGILNLLSPSGGNPALLPGQNPTTLPSPEQYPPPPLTNTTPAGLGQQGILNPAASVKPDDGGGRGSVPVVAVVVPCVAGALLLAALLAIVWASRLKREIIRHVSRDQQALEDDVDAVLGAKMDGQVNGDAGGPAGAQGGGCPPSSLGNGVAIGGGNGRDAVVTVSANNPTASLPPQRARSGGIPISITQPSDGHARLLAKQQQPDVGSGMQVAGIYSRANSLPSRPTAAIAAAATSMPSDWQGTTTLDQQHVKVPTMPFPPPTHTQSTCGYSGCSVISTTDHTASTLTLPSRHSTQSSLPASPPQTCNCCGIPTNQPQLALADKTTTAPALDTSSSNTAAHHPPTSLTQPPSLGQQVCRLPNLGHSSVPPESADDTTISTIKPSVLPQTIVPAADEPALHSTSFEHKSTVQGKGTVRTSSLKHSQHHHTGIEPIPSTSTQHSQSVMGSCQVVPPWWGNVGVSSDGTPGSRAISMQPGWGDPLYGMPLASLLESGMILHDEDSPTAINHHCNHHQLTGTDGGLHDQYASGRVTSPWPSHTTSHVTPMTPPTQEPVHRVVSAPHRLMNTMTTHRAAATQTHTQACPTTLNQGQELSVLMASATDPLPRTAVSNDMATSTHNRGDEVGLVVGTADHVRKQLTADQQVLYVDATGAGQQQGPVVALHATADADAADAARALQANVDEQQVSPLLCAELILHNQLDAQQDDEVTLIMPVAGEDILEHRVGPGSQDNDEVATGSKVSHGRVQGAVTHILRNAQVPRASDAGVALTPNDPPAVPNTSRSGNSSGRQVQAAAGAQQWAAINFARDIVLQRKIGSGAFGTVYAAKWRNAPVAAHTLLGKALTNPGAAADLPVAVKVVPLMLDSASYSARSLDSLKQEVQVLSRVKHPNVIKFMGACLAPPNVCIVEELAEGGSLHAAIHQQGASAGNGGGPHGSNRTPSALPLSAASVSRSLRGGRKTGGLDYHQVLRLGCEVASAMAYLHSLHVVHRDLKAPNVLLDAQGRALVCDFGIAKFRDGRTFLSTKNVHAGTPCYMAPEQFEGRPVSERVDQFAFGVLLWEMLTGELPWSDLDHPMQIIFMVGVQGERLAIPTDCPAPMVEIIEACWRDDPAARPPFAQLEQQLRNLLMTYVG